MFGNEAEISNYILLSLLVLVGAAYFCKGFISHLATLGGLVLSVYVLIPCFESPHKRPFYYPSFN